MTIWTVVTESLQSRWTTFATTVAIALEPITNPGGRAWQKITKPFRRGWRTVPIALCALSSTIGLAVLTLLIVSSTKGDFSGSTGLFAGNCSQAKRLSEILSFSVIAASFLVTFASNKFLCLAVAPLPEEVDTAHARCKWLDIGVNSWRNLQFVSGMRRWSWVIILLSSVPVQLLSNSAIFLTTTSTNYRQVLVSQGFVDGGPWQVPGIATLYYGTGWLSQNDTMTSMVKTIQQQIQNSNWTKLNTDECRKTYLTLPNGLQYYRNLVTVVEAGPDKNATGWTGATVWNGSIPIYYTNISENSYDPNALNTLWYLQPYCAYGICSGQMGYSDFSTLPQDYDFEPWNFQWVESYYSSGDLSAAPNFSPAYDAVTGLYCLAEPFNAPCKIEATNVFMLLVCLCIFIKDICAIVLLLLLRDKEPV